MLVLVFASLAGAADAPVATVTAGVGLAELLHVEAGWLPRDDLEVHLRAGTVVFNVLVGPGVTWRAMGDPRGHAWIWSGYLRVNPWAEPFGLVSGGETLRATTEVYTGYAYTAQGGFLVRARGGALVYLDDGLAAGPNVNVSLGYAFGGR